MTTANEVKNNDHSSITTDEIRRLVTATTAKTAGGSARQCEGGGTTFLSQDSLKCITLPPRTWITAVHKKYHHRLVEFLYASPARPNAATPESTANRGGNVYQQHNNSNNSNVTLLEAPTERGRCLSRRGFHILLSFDVSCPPSAVSPFCRQNVSWTIPVQQQIMVTTQNDRKDTQVPLHLLANSIYKNISSSNPTLLITHKVRVDIYPRTLLEDFCTYLQSAAGSPVDVTVNDPFEGLIAMTASRSQCTLRLTVVVLLDNDNDRSLCTCYWGVQQRPDDNVMIDVALNHEAHNELCIIPMDPLDGSDTMTMTPNGTAIDITVPLCRAYYKLYQVWYDILLPKKKSSMYAGRTALDLGASPGGWTQILVHDVQLGHIICVDPAIMAQRVVHHQRNGLYHNATTVTHVPCMIHKFSSTYFANIKQQDDNKLALSVLVCDASVLWKTLLEEQLATHILPHVVWELPALLVLTCKLPFATTGSIAKQVQCIQTVLPLWLQEHLVPSLGIDADHVHVDWQLLHLFANSDSERTLVITMERV
jgi:hypothetical protein